MNRIKRKQTKTIRPKEETTHNKTGMLKCVCLGHLNRWDLRCEGGQRCQSMWE